MNRPVRSGSRSNRSCVDAVVADVLGQAGALPLLSTALVGTWERRRGDRLTLAGYLEAGGVAGALTRSAEAAFAALDEAGQDLARRLFVRLADTDDGGALVRRRVPLRARPGRARGPARRSWRSSSAGACSPSTASTRGRPRGAARPPGRGSPAGWRTTPPAVPSDGTSPRPPASGRPAAGATTSCTAASGWPRRWTGPVGSGADLTPVEQQFLDASRAGGGRGAGRGAATCRPRRRRRRHRTRRLAAGLAAVLVVALVATFLAVRAQRDAQRASLIADANRLAALSTTAGTLDVSLLLAAQAVRLAAPRRRRTPCWPRLTEHGRAERAIQFDGDPFVANLADDGEVLFFAAGDALSVWRVGLSSPSAR